MARTDAACGKAIEDYVAAKARIGSEHPEGLAAAAAIAVAGAATAAGSTPPPNAATSRLASQLRSLATAQSSMARAMNSGNVDEEMAAFNQAEAAGKAVAATANQLGATQCAAMTQRV